MSKLVWGIPRGAGVVPSLYWKQVSDDSTCQTYCCSCHWKEVLLMAELETPGNSQQKIYHHHRHLGWLQFLYLLVWFGYLLCFIHHFCFPSILPICHLTGSCAVWCRCGWWRWRDFSRGLGFVPVWNPGSNLEALLKAGCVWVLVLRSQVFRIHSHDRISS